ncbi:hypothetical protein B7494_g6103 [Chlorociboria aeruginascens]|nr:hypothetical protein B7494_g6103 [Chlorociboria aeruginascens]
MDLPETQNSRDARIERLWRQLDPQGKGEIDITALQKGLKKIDHPLKNAKDMLQDVVAAMDKNGDQVIQYEEFRTFVEQTEKELLSLFRSIDRDNNGKLDKTELMEAFRKAGMAVPNSKLDQFFNGVDIDNDGYITFEEWRNFLLFLPTTPHTPALKAVLSYYTSTVSVNAEGDTSIRESTLEGLGTSSTFLKSLFGVIIDIAHPKSHSLPVESTKSAKEVRSTTDSRTQEVNETHFHDNIMATNMELNIPLSNPSLSALPKQPQQLKKAEDPISKDFAKRKRSLLIDILPDPGYFAAGGIAGVISRTATAPLDRIKVYLIANIGDTTAPLNSVKQGDAVQAVKHVGRPLLNATKELWKAGGIRSLFAGNGLNVLKVMPESAIRFGSFEATKRALAQLEGHGDSQRLNPYSNFAAGGVGGMIAQLSVYPIDTLKFRMQCETVEGGLRGNALIIATAQKMWVHGGVRSYYRGLTMGLIGMFPYSAIDLGTFEFLKTALTRRNAKLLGCHEDDALPGSFATGCIGACSGAFGASIVYPLNLLRTRLQAQGTILHPPTYTGFWDVAQRTVKNEGVKGLFKGITPNLLKVVPSVSITYVAYEKAKQAMHLR